MLPWEDIETRIELIRATSSLFKFSINNSRVWSSHSLVCGVFWLIRDCPLLEGRDLLLARLDNARLNIMTQILKLIVRKEIQNYLHLIKNQRPMGHNAHLSEQL